MTPPPACDRISLWRFIGDKAGKRNWQSWHIAGMLASGAVLGDKRWVAKAICDPKNGLVFQMHASVSAEGVWYENSWGYHEIVWTK